MRFNMRPVTGASHPEKVEAFFFGLLPATTTRQAKDILPSGAILTLNKAFDV